MTEPENSSILTPCWTTSRLGIAAKDRAVFDAPLTAMLRAGQKAWIKDGDAALVDAAKKSPDRYWQGVTQAAKLAGYYGSLTCPLVIGARDKKHGRIGCVRQLGPQLGLECRV